MKAVSKNISASLRGQSSGGRAAPAIKTGKPGGKLSMTVPGEGGIEAAPGPVNERSAVHYADAMSKQTGR
jgi:hypothetical protein